MKLQNNLIFTDIRVDLSRVRVRSAASQPKKLAPLAICKKLVKATCSKCRSSYVILN